MNESPAKAYALGIGAVLTLVGIIGFFYNSSFTSDEADRDAVLGIFDVNGWHNIVHLATGLLGLAMARTLKSARTYALGLGLVYLIVAIWGFAIGDGENILGIVPVNTEDNFLHLAISLLGLGAYAASKGADESARGAARPTAA